MRKTNNLRNSEIIEAAGGVLWKNTSAKPKLAVIHRPRYNDWTLPKGKRKPGEKWVDTALREVEEETGCQARLGDFIGCVSYLINDHKIPKLVLFWQMFADHGCNFFPNTEVDQIKWVSPEKALKIISYDDERFIVQKAIKQSKKNY